VKVNAADLANLELLRLPAEFKRKLEQAEAVSSGEVPSTIVTMQSRITVTELTTGAHREITLVYPSEATSPDRISVLDPLGAELFGASVGDTVGADQVTRVRIEKIVYQPELSMRTHLFVRTDGGHAA
jgi:regulator of nucleoside diphosphate kinase